MIIASGGCFCSRPCVLSKIWYTILYFPILPNKIHSLFERQTNKEEGKEARVMRKNLFLAAPQGDPVVNLPVCTS